MVGIDTKNIGWSVATAGWITYEWTSRDPVTFPQHLRDRLPPGFRLLLKDIDAEGFAWLYHDDLGVLRLTKEVFDPWHR